MMFSLFATAVIGGYIIATAGLVFLCDWLLTYHEQLEEKKRDLKEKSYHDI
ncbi:hypothetical protein [Algibacillus agarilyticus]|uniref:hypothetical protein n=1 Tax=Algibacillus agarilyticus TaxID=2234133 RepID=UPI0013008D96|nr:hypothetical protein [Algibacillus agarilyticus]